MHHPERHGTPVDHHKDTEIDVKEGGEKGQRENAGGDGEEAPEDVQQCPTVAHAALVIPRVPQELMVGGQNPGERQKGAQGGDAYRESQKNQKM